MGRIVKNNAIHRYRRTNSKVLLVWLYCRYAGSDSIRDALTMTNLVCALSFWLVDSADVIYICGRLKISE